jgi:hypothetical protein
MLASSTSTDNCRKTRRKERHGGKGKPTRAVLFFFDMEIRVNNFIQRIIHCMLQLLILSVRKTKWSRCPVPNNMKH